MPSLGLVITDPARFPAANTMLDVRPLLEALQVRGADVRAVDWADPAVDWSAFDLVVLRSPWDYSMRPAEFDAWLDREADALAPDEDAGDGLAADMAEGVEAARASIDDGRAATSLDRLVAESVAARTEGL